MFNFGPYKRLVIIVITLLLLACTPNRYRIGGQGEGSWFLIEFIGVNAEAQVLGYKPLLFVDSVIYRHNIELKAQKLTFQKSDIKHIKVIAKQEARALYGEEGKDGAVFITLF